MKGQYFLHSDAGHGWLEVPYSDLVNIGVDKEISSFSYQKGDMIYIEEDGDLCRFINAYIKHMDSEPKILSTGHCPNYSSIRNLPHYDRGRKFIGNVGNRLNIYA
jgi:hypothetical protein